jgi:hypothetical protein
MYWTKKMIIFENYNLGVSKNIIISRNILEDPESSNVSRALLKTFRIGECV